MDTLLTRLSRLKLRYTPKAEGFDNKGVVYSELVPKDIEWIVTQTYKAIVIKAVRIFGKM